jgi:hypothetical protein
MANDILSFWLSPLGLIIIVAIIIIVILVYFLIIRKKNKEFKLEQFRDVVMRNLKEKVNFDGVNIKGRLIRDFEPIGSFIDKYCHESGEQLKIGWDEKKENWIPREKVDKIEYDFYIFRMGHNIKLLRLLGIGRKYAVVDRKCMAESPDVNKGNYSVFPLKKDVNFYQHGGVFITSQVTESFVTDLSMAHSYAEAITAFQNFTRYQTYLQVRQSKEIEKIRKKTEIKTKGYKEYETVGDEDDDKEE